jgi:hypothetical protein
MAKTKRVRQTSNLRRKQKSRKPKAKGMKKVISRYLGKILNDVSLKTHNKEFYDDPKMSLVSQIIDNIPTAKTEYKNRLINALALNKKILAEQLAEIKRLEMSGINGPAQRLRSGLKPRMHPALLALNLEKDYTEQAIATNQYALQKLDEYESYKLRNKLRNDELEKLLLVNPREYKLQKQKLLYEIGPKVINYVELLRPKPGWDDERMAYKAREKGREAYYT